MLLQTADNPLKNRHNKKFIRKDSLVFFFFWLVLFLLYYPTANAGMVGDFLPWLDNLKKLSFKEYINWNISNLAVLYQFTQLVTYVCYKIFGINPWGWHLLDVTLQACNSFLLFVICRNLFSDLKIRNAILISFIGALLFTVSPNISEVVVYKPCFHFLLSLMMLLIILLSVQRFFSIPHSRYAWWAGIVFFLSNYSLEIFYFTPLFVLTLALFYRYVLKCDTRIFRKVLLYFIAPQLLLFTIYQVIYHMVFGNRVPHLGGTVLPNPLQYKAMPLKYIYHVLFLGRYYPTDIKHKIYALCETRKGVLIFYSLLTISWIWIIIRFRSMNGKAKAIALLYVWTLLAIALVSPLWFPDIFYILFDRYTYIIDAFIFMLLALVVSFLPGKKIGITLLLLYGFLNICFTIKINSYWKHSAYIVNSLLRQLPPPGNKTVILLNLPQCMEGALMIRALPTSEYKQMHELLLNDKINNTIYDASSYNIITPGDGAHVNVLNDSTIKVTLNQWGTWWWYLDHGALGYENNDYKLNMVDEGHWYLLTLKKPADKYLLLYQVGDKWKITDWKKKNEDQY